MATTLSEGLMMIQKIIGFIFILYALFWVVIKGVW